MEDILLVQWVIDNLQLIKSTQRPTKEQQITVFQIANKLDSTQEHKPSGCGRCYESAKRAIMRNLPTLFI